MHDRKRILAGGAALAALALTPAAADARVNLNPWPPATPSAPPLASPAAPAAARPGFQWDDAAVGAVAGAALLGTAALGGGVARRRRTRLAS
jgi:hypothetical protein